MNLFRLGERNVFENILGMSILMLRDKEGHVYTDARDMLSTMSLSREVVIHLTNIIRGCYATDLCKHVTRYIKV